jgi:putative hydrolase of the HAD superfamily
VIEVIGLDADDTLWHSQNHYHEAERDAAALLSGWIDADDLATRLLEVERVNIGHYGFGAKSFTLSLIETAIDVSNGSVGAATIAGLVEIGRALLQHPVELIDGAEAAITALTDEHHLVVVTKGDLLHQERKLRESGLYDAFDDVHIVSEKTPDTYRRLVDHHLIEPGRMLMVGNSLPSDVLPAREAGLHAAYVPYELVWAYERHDLDADHDVPTLSSLHQLPDHVARLKGAIA